ncbi:hypothetical protein N7470_005667 [Penicillium chermesinum]|nr:hypothetical protein N7470_005667 [Penicillium chermesinum]
MAAQIISSEKNECTITRLWWTAPETPGPAQAAGGTANISAAASGRLHKGPVFNQARQRYRILGRPEVEELATELTRITARAKGGNNLPTKAMGDLTLKEVESIFKITQVTPRNRKAGDFFDILPFDTTTLGNKEAFPEFMRYLSRAMRYQRICQESGCTA